MIRRVQSIAGNTFATKPKLVAPVGDGAFAKIVRSKRIRVGHANEEPFAFEAPSAGGSASGKGFTGESWVIFDKVVKQIGIETIEPVFGEFWRLIPELRSGRFDVIAAGLCISPTRCREVIFSMPTYKVADSLVVFKSNPLNIQSDNDLVRHPTARIGVIFGSAIEKRIRLFNIPATRIIPFVSWEDAERALENREIDAFVSSSLTANSMVHHSVSHQIENVESFKGFLANGRPVVEFGAFAFRKEDKDLRDAVNQVLMGFVGSDEHLQMVRPFGFTSTEMPSPIPSDILTLLNQG